jgi:hypothetical protein
MGEKGAQMWGRSTDVRERDGTLCFTQLYDKSDYMIDAFIEIAEPVL